MAPQKAHTGCTIFGKTVYTNTKQRPNRPFRQSKLKVANMQYKLITVIQLNKVPKNQNVVTYMNVGKGAERIDGNNYEYG